MSSSHTGCSIETLTNRLRRSGSSLLTVAVVCAVVVGTVSIPVAGGQTGEVDESRMAYVDGDSGTVHMVDADGDTADTGVPAEIVGPPADIDDDGTVGVPSVDNQGSLRLVEPDGSTEELATGAASRKTAMALGDYDNSGTTDVIYVSASNSNSIYRVEPGGKPQLVADADARGIIGYGDFDDDGAKEVVYVGESNRIRYVDDDGSRKNTDFSQVGSNNGLGAGPLGDFDGDGSKRVAVVDGSGDLALVDSSGNKEPLNPNYKKAAEAPIAAADVTGNGDIELIYVHKDDKNLYYGTLDHKTSPFNDTSGNHISADDGAGISGGVTTVSGSTADSTAPTVSISEPADGETYGSENVSLDVSADESVSEWNYSLDDGDNQTFDPDTQTTLSNLSDGKHNVTVYAEDDGENVGTDTSTFTVDTTAPTVTISEPVDGGAYENENVSLDVSADEDVSGWNYSLDGGDNQTFDPDTETTLSNLSDGEHNVTVYAEDDGKNVGTDTSTFTVNTSGETNDTDGDGIPDSEEGNGDTDGDGTPDYKDEDSDGDGIPDSEEGTDDTDGDGTPDYKDEDSDGDGIPDSEEGDSDTDGDGTPDYKDEDSDGDGIPDSEEGTDDTDGDGTPDYKDEDSDGDGIPDSEEGTDDTDGDGTPDYKDEDSDGDGIPDSEEGDNDTDGDGTPDYKDEDSDGDGIPDSEEGNGDTDGDGTPDYKDEDSDGDGIPDSEEGTGDADDDGTPNYKDEDSDGDGISDSEEGTDDTDNDGTPDYLDDTDDNIDDGAFGDDDDDDDGSSSGGSVGSSGADENSDDTSNENTTDNETSGDEGTDRNESNEQYTIVNASLSRNEVMVGEEIEVIVEVENAAEERGEFVLQLRNDGTLEKTETFTLPANETTTLRVPYRVTEPGNHTIEANQTVAGTVRAETATEEEEEEENSVGVLSGGGALPAFALLVLIGVVLTLVGYARYRNRTGS